MTELLHVHGSHMEHGIGTREQEAAQCDTRSDQNVGAALEDGIDGGGGAWIIEVRAAGLGGLEARGHLFVGGLCFTELPLSSLLF